MLINLFLTSIFFEKFCKITNEYIHQKITKFIYIWVDIDLKNYGFG